MARRDMNEPGLKPVDDVVATVVAECHRDLVRFLQRQLNDPDEAAEVLRDFFVGAFGGSESVRNAKNLRSWLGRVLQTTLIEHNRRRSPRARGEFPFRPAIFTPVVPEEEIDAVVSACLYKLLPTLKPEYAEIVWQADLVGVSRDRIATSLGTTANNVGVRLHRARRALRRRLAQACVTCPTHGFLNCACEPTAMAEATSPQEAGGARVLARPAVPQVV